MENETKKYISVRQAASMLGVKEQTIYRWIYKGKISVLTLGHKYRINIPLEEIEKYITSK